MGSLNSRVSAASWLLFSEMGADSGVPPRALHCTVVLGASMGAGHRAACSCLKAAGSAPQGKEKLLKTVLLLRCRGGWSAGALGWLAQLPEQCCSLVLSPKHCFNITQCLLLSVLLLHCRPGPEGGYASLIVFSITPAWFKEGEYSAEFLCCPLLLHTTKELNCMGSM